MTREFPAPWCTALKVVTIVSAAILLTVCLLAGSAVPGQILDGWPRRAILLLPAVTLFGAALFVVRGYGLSSDGLAVRRLLWSTAIPLEGAVRAWADPEAMAGSFRVFGNGGLFSISGLFRSRKLGLYRAFATDPKRSVVLATGRRKIVVTPGDPEDFLRHLRLVAPQAEVSSGPSVG